MGDCTNTHRGRDSFAKPTSPLLAEAVALSAPMADLFAAQTSAIGQAAALPALSASDLRAAVAAWQQPIVLGLLAHSRSPSSLVSAADSWGRTPLHLACKAGNSLALTALDTSAALHQRDLFGRTGNRSSDPPLLVVDRPFRLVMDWVVWH